MINQPVDESTNLHVDESILLSESEYSEETEVIISEHVEELEESLSEIE